MLWNIVLCQEATKDTEEREGMNHHQRTTAVNRTDEAVPTYTADAAQLLARPALCKSSPLLRP